MNLKGQFSLHCKTNLYEEKNMSNIIILKKNFYFYFQDFSHKRCDSYENLIRNGCDEYIDNPDHTAQAFKVNYFSIPLLLCY